MVVGGERDRRPAAEPARGRHRVPELRAVPAHDVGRERRPTAWRRAALDARDAAARSAREMLELVQLSAPGRAPAARAVGRPAAARGAGARAGGRPAHPAAGRALRRARQEPAAGHADRDQAHPAPGRHHHASSSRTTRKRRCRWPTASPCSTRAGSSSSRRPPRSTTGRARCSSTGSSAPPTAAGMLGARRRRRARAPGRSAARRWRARAGRALAPARRVMVCVRPEQLRLADGGDGIAGTVELGLPLGADDRARGAHGRRPAPSRSPSRAQPARSRCAAGTRGHACSRRRRRRAARPSSAAIRPDQPRRSHDSMTQPPPPAADAP